MRFVTAIFVIYRFVLLYQFQNQKKFLSVFIFFLHFIINSSPIRIQKHKKYKLLVFCLYKKIIITKNIKNNYEYEIIHITQNISQLKIVQDYRFEFYMAMHFASYLVCLKHKNLQKKSSDQKTNVCWCVSKLEYMIFFNNMPRVDSMNCKLLHKMIRFDISASSVQLIPLYSSSISGTIHTLFLVRLCYTV